MVVVQIRIFLPFVFSKQRIQSHARTKKRIEQTAQNQIPILFWLKTIGFINQNGVYSKL
jgi:hypothetical protein